MKQCNRDDGYRLSDELWERIEPLLPAIKPHPFGYHRPRVANRAAIDAILLVLCTGMQWNTLDETRIWPYPLAYRRFREWMYASVFETFWRFGLLKYDESHPSAAPLTFTNFGRPAAKYRKAALFWADTSCQLSSEPLHFRQPY